MDITAITSLLPATGILTLTVNSLFPASGILPLTITSLLLATGKHCFSEPCEGSDLVLIAEGERFHVHSSVVAWQCHVLHVHLRQTGSREVVLPNKSVDDVLSLLYVLYPFPRPTITGRFSSYSCSVYPFHRPTITGRFTPPSSFHRFYRPTITGRFSPYSCSIYPFNRPTITGKFSPTFMLCLPVTQVHHHG